MRLAALLLIVCGCAAKVEAPPAAPVTQARIGVAALDAKNGFRDLAFGTQRSAVAGLELFDGEIYLRPADKLQIGATPLTSIRYVFWDNGGFQSVYIGAHGFDHGRALFRTLVDAYGEPKRKPDGDAERFAWHGRKVSAFFSYDAATETASVSFASSEILERVRNANIAANAKAASADL